MKIYWLTSIIISAFSTMHFGRFLLFGKKASFEIGFVLIDEWRSRSVTKLYTTFKKERYPKENPLFLNCFLFE